MNALNHALSTGSRTVSYILGGAVIILALTAMGSQLSVGEITDWVHRVFGYTFIALLAGLVFTALFCWVRLSHAVTASPSDAVWLEAGLQAANGVTTLALTYTLLGISLGIGSLAGQSLTPETVQPIIRALTENFSLAFMTTVVGLPISAVLRAMLLVSHARRQEQSELAQA